MGEKQEDNQLVPINSNTSKESNIKELPKFKIVSEGGLKYIADAQTGNIVSKGYHDFEVYRNEGSEGRPTFVTLLGKKGAVKRALRLSEDNNGSPYFEESPEDFHDMEVREDLGNLILVQTGSMKHIVNPSTGTKASEGYHDFYEKDGKLYGKSGAFTEEVDVSGLRPNTEFLLEEENPS